MRKTITIALATAALVAAVATPSFASGDPQREGGKFRTDYVSVNGGDNGYGNCGYNRSGGLEPVQGVSRGGIGGHKRGEKCYADPAEAPELTVTPSDEPAPEPAPEPVYNT